MAALRTVRRLTGGSRGFSAYMALGPTFWDFAECHWWKFWCFFWGFGAFRPPNSAKLFLAGPITAPLEKKKGLQNYYFFARQWVQNPAKPRFIEIEIEKSRSRAPCSVGQRRSALVPLQIPDSFEKFKKKCAGTASRCDFCRTPA